jgi:hypothetical protein
MPAEFLLAIAHPSLDTASEPECAGSTVPDAQLSCVRESSSIEDGTCVLTVCELKFCYSLYYLHCKPEWNKVNGVLKLLIGGLTIDNLINQSKRNTLPDILLSHEY